MEIATIFKDAQVIKVDNSRNKLFNYKDFDYPNQINRGPVSLDKNTYMGFDEKRTPYLINEIHISNLPKLPFFVGRWIDWARKTKLSFYALTFTNSIPPEVDNWVGLDDERWDRLVLAFYHGWKVENSNSTN